MHEHFDAWCKAVVSRVRFRPDREAIRRELAAHYEDSVRDYVCIGYDEELARSRALTAMGDAAEVGDGLDKAHKPWLGWLWIVSSVIVALAAIFAVAYMLEYQIVDMAGRLNFRPESTYEVLDWTTEIRCPMDFSSGVYDFKFEKAEYYWDGYAGSVMVTFHAYTPRFWLGGPDLKALTAVDSEGHTYAPYAERDLYGESDRGRIYTACRIIIDLEEVPQWIEVTHESAGWSFRVELPQEGGNA